MKIAFGVLSLAIASVTAYYAAGELGVALVCVAGLGAVSLLAGILDRC